MKNWTAFRNDGESCWHVWKKYSIDTNALNVYTLNVALTFHLLFLFHSKNKYCSYRYLSFHFYESYANLCYGLPQWHFLSFSLFFGSHAKANKRGLIDEAWMSRESPQIDMFIKSKSSWLSKKVCVEEKRKVQWVPLNEQERLWG